ncbi:uncharacterized protein C8R40DRAFT_842861 [Lentinula edodes]|uniref:uncharacterized protein n=1 Tax=Lentinula edodes TaxID=5353 RepID=UPI001E8D03FA|nr:uncharacterized protein C8R40DRAFT_842861 [Lentinula edodes]KAH7868405.1 hypothetical protein C8R40DRAFT_842861 [Lentinula edodes]
MATPSSSATSPSPPMAYLQPVVPIVPSSQGPSSSSLSSLSPSTDSGEGERRKKAVQKFLARAELSNVTRTLRTRLSYASSKTNHNITSPSLGDLEAQSQSTSSAVPRSYAAKRKAPSQPVGNAMPSPLRRGSLGPRPRTPANTGNVGASTSTATTESNTQTLFTSILAPPPSNQARTILNANDPPVAAPVRPAMSPKVRNVNNDKAVKSIAESTRAHAKSRRQPDKRKDKRKSRKAVDADGDVDMEAAATLTSLLLHHRPSIAGSASSPRSSIDGSEAGTPYSQQPISARSSFSSIPPSNTASNASISYRSNTPPRSSNTNVQQQQGQSTPRPAPTDNEAADLMLFLATSPSPARPTTSKDARDAAAFHALTHSDNGNMMRAKPRVLFPTQGDFADESGITHPSSAVGTRLLNSDGFTNSNISRTGTDVEPPVHHSTTDRSSSASQQHTAVQLQQQPASSTVHGTYLLPPPSLPSSQRPTPSSFPSSPSSLRNESSPRPEHPIAGGQTDFNFSEYIHASPTRPGSGSGHPANSQKANLGLRADVGRKLFEEEQIRLQQKRRPEDRGLEAGIDLVRT